MTQCSPLTLPLTGCPQVGDDVIYAYFLVEMLIKMVAMGVYGEGTYLAESWNRLDFFIVAAG